MAYITISDLKATGFDLFNDQESFLNEVTQEELALTNGGITPSVILITIAEGILGGAAGITFSLATKKAGWW